MQINQQPREATHNPKVAGSNPAPATNEGPGQSSFWSGPCRVLGRSSNGPWFTVRFRELEWDASGPCVGWLSAPSASHRRRVVGRLGCRAAALWMTLSRWPVIVGQGHADRTRVADQDLGWGSDLEPTTQARADPDHSVESVASVILVSSLEEFGSSLHRFVATALSSGYATSIFTSVTACPASSAWPWASIAVANSGVCRCSADDDLDFVV